MMMKMTQTKKTQGKWTMCEEDGYFLWIDPSGNRKPGYGSFRSASEAVEALDEILSAPPIDRSKDLFGVRGLSERNRRIHQNNATILGRLARGEGDR